MGVATLLHLEDTDSRHSCTFPKVYLGIEFALQIYQLRLDIHKISMFAAPYNSFPRYKTKD